MSALGHPLCHGLLCDEVVTEALSARETLKRYMAFEIALARAKAAEGLSSPDSPAEILEAAKSFKPDMKTLAEDTQRDGLPVPSFVRQFRATLGSEAAADFHSGATSQDVMDTANSLALQRLNSHFSNRMDALAERLRALSDRHSHTPLMGRTRMQAALPIEAGQRIESWLALARDVKSELGRLAPKVEALQLGGPVGNREAFGAKGDAVARRMAEELGLSNPPCWHSNRLALAEYASWLSAASGAMGKFGKDVLLMAQTEISEIRIAGAGSSSAMPHKRNPVRAEILVALARHSAGLLPGMHHALVHEMERSGAAWTLEWLVLPRMCEAAGASLGNALALAESIEEIKPAG